MVTYFFLPKARGPAGPTRPEGPMEPLGPTSPVKAVLAAAAGAAGWAGAWGTICWAAETRLSIWLLTCGCRFWVWAWPWESSAWIWGAIQSKSSARFLAKKNGLSFGLQFLLWKNNQFSHVNNQN